MQFFSLHGISLFDITTLKLHINVYSKTCVKRPLKIDKTKVLMTPGSLMKVESIAECLL